MKSRLIIVLIIVVFIVFEVGLFLVGKNIGASLVKSLSPRPIAKLALGNGLVISLVCDDNRTVSMVSPLDGELNSVIKGK